MSNALPPDAPAPSSPASPAPAAPSAALYDAYYYQNWCGDVHERNEKTLAAFDSIAEKIVRGIGPKTALDAGCAIGLLVETLRARGVDAEGFDISSFAIGEAPEELKPYVRVGSILEPPTKRYDLVICMEVVEHLDPKDADTAISTLCAAADDVIFASSPSDFKQNTHFNVRPPEYWANLFGQRGFFRDFGVDVTFVMPWAMRFRKTGEPAHRIIEGYEREAWQAAQRERGLRESSNEAHIRVREVEEAFGRVHGELEKVTEEQGNALKEIAHLREVIAERDAKISAIESSRLYRLVNRLRGGK